MYMNCISHAYSMSEYLIPPPNPPLASLLPQIQWRPLIQDCIAFRHVNSLFLFSSFIICTSISFTHSLPPMHAVHTRHQTLTALCRPIRLNDMMYVLNVCCRLSTVMVSARGCFIASHSTSQSHVWS